jgi:hypothetical protein
VFDEAADDGHNHNLREFNRSLAMNARWVSSTVRHRLVAGCAVIGVATLILPACESLGLSKSPGSPEGPTASAVRHPTLDDIPVPTGFRLVDDHSVSRIDGHFRVVRFEFIGDMERASLNRFYKEYMAAGGWTLRQERFDRGIYDMRFESDAEECLIRLKPENKRTAIVVDLGPLPRGSAEREAQPALPPP